jgi:hypothetical protein
MRVLRGSEKRARAIAVIQNARLVKHNYIAVTCKLMMTTGHSWRPANAMHDVNRHSGQADKGATRSHFNVLTSTWILAYRMTSLIESVGHQTRAISKTTCVRPSTPTVRLERSEAESKDKRPQVIRFSVGTALPWITSRSGRCVVSEYTQQTFLLYRRGGFDLNQTARAQSMAKLV